MGCKRTAYVGYSRPVPTNINFICPVFSSTCDFCGLQGAGGVVLLAIGGPDGTGKLLATPKVEKRDKNVPLICEFREYLLCYE
jgi:hypothetical protein